MQHKTLNKDLYTRKPGTAIAICMIFVTLIPIVCNVIFFTQADKTVYEQQESMVSQSLLITGQKLDSDMEEIEQVAAQLKQRLKMVPIPDEDTFTIPTHHEFYDARSILKETLEATSGFVKTAILYREGAGYILTPSTIYNSDQVNAALVRKYGISEAEWQAICAAPDDMLVNTQRHVVYTIHLPSKAGKEYQDRKVALIFSSDYFITIADNYGLGNAGYRFHSLRDGSYLGEAYGNVSSGDTIVRESNTRYYRITVNIPDEFHYGQSQTLKKIYVILFAVSVVLASVLIYVLSRKTTMPIRDMIDYVRTRCKTDLANNTEGLNLIRDSIDELLFEQKEQKRQIEQYRQNEQRHGIVEAMLGFSETTLEHPYAVACLIGQERAREACNEFTIEGFEVLCIVFGDSTALLLEKLNDKTDEDEMERTLENILQKLDDARIPDCLCSMSRVHTGAGELEEAWREASIAADSLRHDKNTAIMRFDTIRYTPEYFLRDKHHLDKQLKISGEIERGEYNEALSTLNDLFPEEYLNNEYPNMARLHLNTLKYQFLHDMDALAESLPDADELRRNMAREILACKNHQALYELIERELRNAGNTLRSEEEPEEIKKIKEYIRSVSSDPLLNVTAVADHFGISIDKLSRSFSQSVGMGVLQYIHKIRIESACNILLNNQTLSIAEVATKVGYGSVLTFSRAFKARYSMTPGEYRKIHLANEP